MRSIRHLPGHCTIALTDGRWEQSRLRAVQQEKHVFLSLISKNQPKKNAALSDEKQQGNAPVYKVL